MPTRNLPLPVRLYWRLSSWLLPDELLEEFGRAINETFYDRYRQAGRTQGLTARLRLLLRELRALAETAIDERRRRRERASLHALRALPRTDETARRRPPTASSPRYPMMIDNVLQDLRFAFRSLRKSPIFTLVAVTTLALGIGANTAVFSVVNGVLLAPLPYEEPEELMLIWTNFGATLPQNWVSGPELVEIREFNQTFEGVGVAIPFTTSFTGQGEPVQVPAAVASGNFFSVLGVSAQQGRLILPEDDVPNGDSRVVISDGLWTRRLARDPAAIGQTIELGGNQATVIGVLPPDFRVLHPQFTSKVDVWLPYTTAVGTDYAQMSRGSHGMRAFGRLRDGVSHEQARADLDRVAARMTEVNPDSYSFEGWGLTGIPLHEDLVEDVEWGLVVLLGAVAFVLLIACVNVANLQLARAATREREIALRTAVGASRGRLVQQLFTESAVLAGLGAVGGLLVATAVLRGLLQVAPAYLPRLENIAIDRNVLLFTMGAGLLTALLFGIAPWVFTLRTSLTDSLREGGRGASAGPAGSRARGGLVVAEVALAVVLLVGAGLMVRSFTRLMATDPGYETDQILTLQISLPGATYTPPDQLAFWRELLERVRGLGAVSEAALVSHLPLSGAYSSGTTMVDESEFGQTDPRVPYRFIEADRRQVSDGYFETMEIEVVAGRSFAPADNRSDAEPVVIVDERFARTFWPESDPLQHRIVLRRVQNPDTGEQEPVWARIVGVVRHARHYGVGEDGREQIYFPVEQMPNSRMFLTVRAAADAQALSGAVREQVWALDPDRPVDDIATMSMRVADSVSQPRFNALLLGAMALVAAILAAIGLYGVIAFAVGQRSNEIGVRMALGASARSVRRMVLRQGLTMVAVGLALGAVAALGLGRMISTLLYSVSSTDPLTYIGVAALLTLVATAACLVPAARATRIDPANALRDE